jgi:hypothetical protein
MIVNKKESYFGLVIEGFQLFWNMTSQMRVLLIL